MLPIPLENHPIHPDYAQRHRQALDFFAALRAGQITVDETSPAFREHALWVGLSIWPTPKQPEVVASFQAIGISDLRRRWQACAEREAARHAEQMSERQNSKQQRQSKIWGTSP